MTIIIKHTHEDGTLVHGTVKGDGVYDIIRKPENGGFRYFPSIQMIGLRGSRDQIADRYRIAKAAEALRAAGFTVEVEIDDTPRDRAQVLADKAARLEDRRAALTAKAARHADKAMAAHDRAHQISQRFTGGQPIIAGHHSECGARRDQKRMHAAMATSVREHKTAQEMARRASAVGSQLQRSATPAVTRRRIERTEAELRKIQRSLDGYTRTHRDHAGTPFYVERHEPAAGDYRESLLARKAQLENQLAHDQAQLAAAIEAGEYVMWDKHNVHVGDVVTYWGLTPRTVLKVNPKTVSVESGYSWPDKVSYAGIRAVQCPHGSGGPTITTTTKRAPQARPKVEVPDIDTDKLQALADLATNMEVSRDRGAFVTPPAVVDQLMELADLRPGDTMLEPSAGTGNIAAAAVERGAIVDCVEIDAGLVEVLTSRVSDVNMLACSDFLDLDTSQLGTYDRVVMNPPFSRGRDIAHVTHALQFLKPGGRLVAVMGAGVTFHQVKAAQDFRKLVADRGGQIIPLSKDAFSAAGLQVSMVIVVIPADASAIDGMRRSA